MNSRRFDWSLSRFDELDVHTLYDALALRSEVFVVEQNCAYADIDELDKLPGSRHLVARCGNTLCAYARSLAPSDTHADARIGRVVVRQSFRRQGLANRLLSQLIEDLGARFPHISIRLDAQIEAEGLYVGAGFKRCGDEFLEDGIPHVSMRREAEVQPML
jgi:ElaA protein